jgi:hypothetical protein
MGRALQAGARVRIIEIAFALLASGLFEATVEVEAQAADEQVGHPDHDIDALVVGAGFPQGVIIVLRTGGNKGVFSVGTGVNGAGSDERHSERRDEEQQGRRVERDAWCVGRNSSRNS